MFGDSASRGGSGAVSGCCVPARRTKRPWLSRTNSGDLFSATKILIIQPWNDLPSPLWLSSPNRCSLLMRAEHGCFSSRTVYVLKRLYLSGRGRRSRLLLHPRQSSNVFDQLAWNERQCRSEERRGK